MDGDSKDVKKMTVVYLRGRGTGTGDPARSIDEEERDLRRRLSEAGVDPADALVLNGVTGPGVASRRPGGSPPLDHLVGLLEAGRVGVLATTSPTTLGRDLSVWSIVRAMTEQGVTLVTADGPWSTEKLSILAMVQETATTLHAARARRRSNRA